MGIWYAAPRPRCPETMWVSVARRKVLLTTMGKLNSLYFQSIHFFKNNACIEIMVPTENFKLACSGKQENLQVNCTYLLLLEKVLMLEYTILSILPV